LLHISIVIPVSLVILSALEQSLIWHILKVSA
jgi:hypothetical protein